MFSIYSIAFNVIKNNFDYKNAVHNFCCFAPEVVIAINKSEDNTWEAFQELTKKYENLKLVAADVDYDDPCIDGKLFNLALQNTTKEFKIILALDHRIPLRQRENWEQAAYGLRFANEDAYFIPVVNLWGDERKVRWDNESNTSFMWFLHKQGLERGVVNFAKLDSGKFDPSRSDSNELIYPNGELVNFIPIYKINNSPSLEEYTSVLSEHEIYVYHLGYIDFDNRIKVNKDIWQKQWEEIRPPSKRTNQVAVKISDLEKHATFHHNLKLWYE